MWCHPPRNDPTVYRWWSHHFCPGRYLLDLQWAHWTRRMAEPSWWNRSYTARDHLCHQRSCTVLGRPVQWRELWWWRLPGWSCQRWTLFCGDQRLESRSWSHGGCSQQWWNQYGDWCRRLSRTPPRWVCIPVTILALAGTQWFCAVHPGHRMPADSHSDPVPFHRLGSWHWRRVWSQVFSYYLGPLHSPEV